MLREQVAAKSGRIHPFDSSHRHNSRRVGNSETDPLPNSSAPNHQHRNDRLQHGLAAVAGNRLTRGVAQAN